MSGNGNGGTGSGGVTFHGVTPDISNPFAPNVQNRTMTTSWHTFGGQTIGLRLVYDIATYRFDKPQMCLLSLDFTGTTVEVDGMAQNKSSERGYFLWTVDVTASVNHFATGEPDSNVELIGDSPATTSQTGSSQQTNTLSVGFQGLGGTGSGSASMSSTINLQDFSVHNASLGNDLHHVYWMSMTGGAKALTYNDGVGQLFHHGASTATVDKVPSSAYGNYAIGSLGLWKAPYDYMQTDPVGTPTSSTMTVNVTPTFYALYRHDGYWGTDTYENPQEPALSANWPFTWLPASYFGATGGTGGTGGTAIVIEYEEIDEIDGPVG